MSPASGRIVLAGGAFLAIGVVLIAIGAWMSADPGSTQVRRLLSGGAFVLGGVSCLATAHRWMRQGTPTGASAPRLGDGSVDG